MRERILEHLFIYGTITSWEAILDYGCTHPTEYIRQLRKNYIIEDEWIPATTRYGVKTRYKKYYFKGKKEN